MFPGGSSDGLCVLGATGAMLAAPRSVPRRSMCGCVLAYGSLFPHGFAECVTGQDKMPDFWSLKHSALGRCFRLTSFPLYPITDQSGN